jgi:hypothetical protein
MKQKTKTNKQQQQKNENKNKNRHNTKQNKTKTNKTKTIGYWINYIKKIIAKLHILKKSYIKMIIKGCR